MKMIMMAEGVDEGCAVAFANKVNALGLALTKLKPFKETGVCF